MGSTLAIDIGGTKFTLALFQEGAITRRETHPTDRAGGRDWMLRRIAGIVRGWNTPFDRCGIGFGGPVNFAGQRIELSTHVGGWADFDLGRWARETLGLPPGRDAVIDNDANCGALGEALHGAGVGFRPLFYLTLSTGIGGGIVLGDDSLYRGADSWAGEIGHAPLRPPSDPDAPQCLCGSTGCFERLCGGLWLDRDHGKPAKDLMLDERFVKGYVVDVAQGLKIAIMLINPARIVIGGGIAKAGDRLFVPLRAELARQMPAWSRARIEVVPAALDDASVLWGAYEIANLEK